MPLAPIASPEKHLILVVDDEPDIFRITELSLKGLSVRGREIELIPASTGEEAVQIMQARPEIAVILLDVVMETNAAGLDACRKIREELGNPFARILLRTGFPGEAPERETIDTYDIDGYLPKAELTSTRLYSAVRTALKAWEELIELERHRELLASIHDCVVSLRSFDSLEVSLTRILETAVAICPASLAVLYLETFEEEGTPKQRLMHLSSGPGAAAAAVVASRMRAGATDPARREAGPVEGGYQVPLVLHRELGYGWIYLASVTPDPLVQMGLPLLATHAANALYATVAQALLADREGPIFDTINI